MQDIIDSQLVPTIKFFLLVSWRSSFFPTTVPHSPTSLTRSSLIIKHYTHWNNLWFIISQTPFIHSFIHSDYFYSTSSSPLLRGAPDTARPKRHRQQRVKDLSKVPAWRRSGIRTHDPSYERRRIYQWTTTPHIAIDTRLPFAQKLLRSRPRAL